MSRAVSSAFPKRRGFLNLGIAVFGILWNSYGLVQLVGTLQSTPESLMQMGMTQMQATTYTSYPTWMNVAFALGAAGGLLGSVFLLARRALAPKIFAVSLAGYVALFSGDLLHGVFAALGPSQVVVLTFVVVVAGALLVWSRAIAQRALVQQGAPS